MPKDGGNISPDREEKGFLWKELRLLIDILQDLHLKISSKLLEKRMQSANFSTIEEHSVDISQTLKDYIDTNLSAQVQTGKVPGNPQQSSAQPPAEKISVDAAPETTFPSDTLTYPNELSGYLKEQAASHEFAHHMDEKMRIITLEHINRTLQLAKLGNREVAYVHAELAENSMRLAREYMSETEFEIFENEVKERVNTAKLKTQGILE